MFQGRPQVLPVRARPERERQAAAREHPGRAAVHGGALRGRPGVCAHALQGRKDRSGAGFRETCMLVASS